MMARKQHDATQQPISLSQARRSRRRGVAGVAGKPPGGYAALASSMSAADQLAARVNLKERTELTGRVDPYHAHRGGYWQGSMDALSVLEQLLDAGIDLDTALAEQRAWLLGADFGQWVNAPDDPQDILPGSWLARRRHSV